MISDFLTENSIIPSLRAESKKEALCEMAKTISAVAGIQPSESLETALLRRENLGNSSIGDGVAIPHVRHDRFAGVAAMFARSREGIDFYSLDGKRIHYFFLLISGRGVAGLHLKLLARISRLVRLKGFFDTIDSLKTSKEILRFVKTAETSFCAGNG